MKTILIFFLSLLIQFQCLKAADNILITNAIIELDWDLDGNTDAQMSYIEARSILPSMRIPSFFLFLSPSEPNLFYLANGSEININDPSKSAPPILIFGAGGKDSFLKTNVTLWDAIGGSGPFDFGYGYDGPIGVGHAFVFGLSVVRPTGRHFGWARVQGTNGLTYGGNYGNRLTNRPPVFSEITINPVPWAAIPLGRPSPGGPKLSFTRQKNNTLRLTYPDWGTRYAVRRRTGPKGPVAQIYAGGHEGLVATNGVFTVDVPLDQTNGYFELFLPAANR